MRKRNWPKYNRELVQRGSLSFFIDPKDLKSLKCKNKKRSNGRPLEFSDPLIQLLFMIKIRFHLPYRSLEGFSKSVFAKMKKWLHLPTYSLICKRVEQLEATLPKLSNRRPCCIIFDASGWKVIGEGEWKVKIHGKSKPRQWIKIHIALDAKTQEIVAEVTTESNIADFRMVAPLLDQMPNSVKKVLGDGAYDRSQSREAIRKKKAKALIPPPRNARIRGSSERDHAILEIQGLGGDEIARSIWRKLSGYSRRSLVESAFSSLKRMFGDRLFSKKFKNQRIESRVRCILLNKMRAMAA
jgi:hypothetical protein